MANLVTLHAPKRTIESSQQARVGKSTRGRWQALWACGFRPFFLAAASSSLLSILLWVLLFLGVVPTRPSFVASLWHAHELLFGFAGATIAGFLLTAGAKWTQTPFTCGPRLQAVVGLWFIARITAWISGEFVAWANLAFWLGLMSALAGPIWRGKNRYNRGFLLILGALGAMSFLSARGFSVASQAAISLSRGAQQLAISLICLLIFVILGRVLPMFTRNALALLPVEFSPKPPSYVTPVGVAAAVASLIAAGVPVLAHTPLAAVFQGLWALMVIVRIHALYHRAIWRVPILAILHIGQIWLALGLCLLSASALTSLIAPLAGVHALTAGAMGTLIIGFMSRVCLGHTGRELKTGRWTHVMYLLVLASAVIRIVGCWLPSRLLWSSSAVAWAAAMLLFLIVYAPMLVSPRPDGQPG